MLLGLDLGTSGIKAMLMDRSGQVHGLAAVPTPFDGGELPVTGLVAAVGRVCSALGDVNCRRVAAVAIAGMAESGAPLDSAGRPLAPVIVWHDPRGAEVVERLRARFGGDLEGWTGRRLRTVSSVAKLGWLVDHGVGPPSSWLGVAELVLHALTGSQATDFSLAARTGAYHVGERRWLPEVAGALGVRPEVFPAVAPAGAVMGVVSPGGAIWSGLPPGTPVTVAGHDHLVGRTGSGAGPDDLVNSVGTAETVMAGAAVLPDVHRAISLQVAVTLEPGGQGWVLLASAARAGLVVSGVADALAATPQELDRAAVSAGRVAMAPDFIDAVLRGEAVKAPPGAAGAVWNGVLDALAMRAWDAVDRLQHAARDRPDPPPGLVVFGGGSRSRPWLQAKADARPDVAVWRSDAVEAVARGAALSAGAAAGWWRSPDDGPRSSLERIPT